MRRTRRRKRVNRKPRKDARTIPVWGDPDRGGGEDHNRYWRCWNCLSINDIERDARPKTHGHSGIPDTESTISELPLPYGTHEQYPGTAYLLVGGAGPQRSHVLENPSKQAKSYFEIDAPGCWFCGCPNWRNDA